MATQDPSKKQIFEKDEPFRVFCVINHTVSVEFNSKLNTQSINLIPLAKKTEKCMSTAKKTFQEDVQKNHSDTSNDKNFVERTILFKDDDKGTGYVVRRYGYRSADDTGEQPHITAQHFVESYWRRRKFTRAIARV